MSKINLTYNFDTEDELRAHLDGQTRSVHTAPAAPEAPRPATEDADILAAASGPAGRVDSDGMPHDPNIHAENGATNQDGTWKARKGKAAEAKAAREAFKAGGGGEEAPETEERADEPAATGMPGMPAAIPNESPEPVTFDQVVTKINGMLERGKIDSAGIADQYEKAGSADVRQYQTNETLRAKLFSALCEIEPELS